MQSGNFTKAISGTCDEITHLRVIAAHFDAIERGERDAVHSATSRALHPQIQMRGEFHAIADAVRLFIVADENGGGFLKTGCHESVLYTGRSDLPSIATHVKTRARARNKNFFATLPMNEPTSLQRFKQLTWAFGALCLLSACGTSSRGPVADSAEDNHALTEAPQGVGLRVAAHGTEVDAILPPQGPEELEQLAEGNRKFQDDVDAIASPSQQAVVAQKTLPSDAFNP
jgi:hypothetical protein